MNIWLDPRAPLSFFLMSVNSGDCCVLEPEWPRLHMTPTVEWKSGVPGFKLHCFLFILRWWLSSDDIAFFVIAEDLIQHITVKALMNRWEPEVIICAMDTDHHYGPSNVSPELLCLIVSRHILWKMWKREDNAYVCLQLEDVCVFVSAGKWFTISPHDALLNCGVFLKHCITGLSN